MFCFAINTRIKRSRQRPYPLILVYVILLHFIALVCAALFWIFVKIALQPKLVAWLFSALGFVKLYHLGL